jgi:DNA-binding transcriptional MerR regulator
VVEKAPDAFRTISEVADDLDLPQHVLRFWETRFQQIKPLKRGGGRRYYRPDDIDLLRGIRYLLYGEGYTIRGAQRILKDHGIKFVQHVWKPGAAQPARSVAPPVEAVEPEVEVDIPEPVAARPSHGGGRRGDSDPAHRRLFGLLPSFLSSGALDEERLAESRRVDDEALASTPMIPLTMKSEPPPAPKPALSGEGLAKLRDTLSELQECRKLLEAAAASEPG